MLSLRQKFLLASLGLFASLYFGLLMTFGRFAHTDEVFFKAAGREWAVNGRFAAPELKGFLDVKPPVESIFFLHPPMYPFLFGLFVKLFGFGWRACVAYDGLLHLALVGLTYLLGHRFSSSSEVGVLAGAAILPLGTTSRPDELAMCFGLLAVLAVIRQPLTTFRSAVAGGFLGAAAGTSVGAAIILGLAAAALALASPANLATRVRMFGACSLAAAFVLGAVLAPILLAHPDAYQQYLGLAANQVGKGEWISGVQFAWRYGKGVIVLESVCLAVSVIALLSKRDSSRIELLSLVGPMLGVVFVMLMFPVKYTYLWFVGPWLLIVAMAAASRIRPTALRSTCFSLVAAAVLFGSLNYLRQTLVAGTLPAEQGIEASEKRLRELVPPGTTVLALESWWSLGTDHVVLDSFFSGHRNLDNIDYIVLTGNGSGIPGKPHAVSGFSDKSIARQFVVIDDRLAREPFRIFGRAVTKSAYGFGTLILENRRLVPMAHAK